MFKDAKTYKALLAEFIGTLLLVFVGTGSGTSWDGLPVSVTQGSLAVGLIVGSLVQALGHVSGAHINPAVTVSMMVTRKINPILGVLYVVVQCLGATAGSALLKSVTPIAIQGTLGSTVPAPELSAIQAVGVEFLATCVLVFTIYGACDEKRDDVKGSVPLAIGIAAVASNLVAVPFTGCSMNPARSLGPAIMTSTWHLHWVYWVGPCLGSIFSGVVYQLVFRAHRQRPEPKRGNAREYEMCAKNDS